RHVGALVDRLRVAGGYLQPHAAVRRLAEERVRAAAAEGREGDEQVVVRLGADGERRPGGRNRGGDVVEAAHFDDVIVPAEGDLDAHETKTAASLRRFRARVM